MHRQLVWNISSHAVLRRYTEMHPKTVLFQIVAISLCMLSCLGGDVVSSLQFFFIFLNETTL